MIKLGEDYYRKEDVTEEGHLPRMQMMPTGPHVGFLMFDAHVWVTPLRRYIAIPTLEAPDLHLATYSCIDVRQQVGVSQRVYLYEEEDFEKVKASWPSIQWRITLTVVVSRFGEEAWRTTHGFRVERRS